MRCCSCRFCPGVGAQLCYHLPKVIQRAKTLRPPRSSSFSRTWPLWDDECCQGRPQTAHQLQPVTVLSMCCYRSSNRHSEHTVVLCQRHQEWHKAVSQHISCMCRRSRSPPVACDVQLELMLGPELLLNARLHELKRGLIHPVIQRWAWHALIIPRLSKVQIPTRRGCIM